MCLKLPNSCFYIIRIIFRRSKCLWVLAIAFPLQEYLRCLFSFRSTLLVPFIKKNCAFTD